MNKQSLAKRLTKIAADLSKKEFSKEEIADQNFQMAMDFVKENVHKIKHGKPDADNLKELDIARNYYMIEFKDEYRNSTRINIMSTGANICGDGAPNSVELDSVENGALLKLEVVDFIRKINKILRS